MNDKSNVKLTERQQHWLTHLRACEAAEKSIAAYAKENAINVETLYAMRTVLVAKGVLAKPQRATFQRAQIKLPLARSDWRVQLPNGISVMFNDASDTKALSSVLQVAANL